MRARSRREGGRRERRKRRTPTHPLLLVLGPVPLLLELDLVRLLALLDNDAPQVGPARRQQAPQRLDAALVRKAHRPLLVRHGHLDAHEQVAARAVAPHALARYDDLVARLEDAPAALARRGLRDAQAAPVEVDEDEAREAEERLGEGEREGRREVGGWAGTA